MMIFLATTAEREIFEETGVKSGANYMYISHKYILKLDFGIGMMTPLVHFPKLSLRLLIDDLAVEYAGLISAL